MRGDDTCDVCGVDLNMLELDWQRCYYCRYVLWAIRGLDDLAKRTALHKVIAYLAKKVDD